MKTKIYAAPAVKGLIPSLAKPQLASELDNIAKDVFCVLAASLCWYQQFHEKCEGSLVESLIG